MKSARLALLSFVLLVAGAAPASAAPILAKAKPWHFWIAPVLTLSFVGLVFFLGMGYLIRVTMAKYGIRIGPNRSEG